MVVDDWPSWSCFVAVMVVADMVSFVADMVCGRYGRTPLRPLTRGSVHCGWGHSPQDRHSPMLSMWPLAETVNPPVIDTEWSPYLLIFLLLARYVPNVAKRSIWDQCKKKYILRTDRPTTDRRPATDQRPHIWENSNGHISARGRPIHFMFGSTVGFSGSADRMALTPGNSAMQRG